MEITNLSDQELIQQLANATTTYYQAGGHTKARLNEIAMKEFHQEMLNRRIDIPENEELFKIGVFNGKGAR